MVTGTAAAAAKPSPLYSTTGGWSCANGAFNTSGNSYGTVAIRVDQTETLATVTLRLRDAAPNTTYDLVVMESVGSGCSIPLSFAPLTTNDLDWSSSPAYDRDPTSGPAEKERKCGHSKTSATASPTGSRRT
jgi:hypothetical protein